MTGQPIPADLIDNRMRKEWICYAFLSENGEIIADSGFNTAGSAWRVGLGWPDQNEIEDAKKRGAEVFQVTITRKT